MNPTEATSAGAQARQSDWLGGRRWWAAVCAVIGASLIVGFSQGLLPRPLETHEVFVAQTSREMLARSDWIEPSFNFEPRLKKPPLMYWLVMTGAIAIGNEVAIPPWLARLPSAFAGAALVGLTIAIGVLVSGRRIGMLSGLLAAGMLGFSQYANNARPEMVYAALCSIALIGLVRAWRAADRSASQAAWALCAWLGMALATLAKGPHMPALILAGFILFMMLERERARILSVLRPFAGLAAMVVVTAPWVVLVSRRSGDPLGLWIGELTDTAGGEQHSFAQWLQPYYLWGLPEILLPWAILLPLAAFVPFHRGREDLRPARAVFWVVALCVGLLQLLPQRRGYYLLPVLPAISVLMAVGFIEFAHGAARIRRIGWLSLAMVIIALGFVIAVGALSRDSRPVLIACVLGVAPLVVLLAAAWRVARSAAPSPALLLAIPAAAAIIAATAVGSSPALHPDSPLAWARFENEVAAAVAPGDPVGVYSDEAGRLVYRLNRRIETFDAIDDLAAAVQTGAVWVVTPEAEAERIKERIDAEIVARLDFCGSDEEPMVLARCTARPGKRSQEQ